MEALMIKVLILIFCISSFASVEQVHPLTKKCEQEFSFNNNLVTCFGDLVTPGAELEPYEPVMNELSEWAWMIEKAKAEVGVLSAQVKYENRMLEVVSSPNTDENKYLYEKIKDNFDKFVNVTRKIEEDSNILKNCEENKEALDKFKYQNQNIYFHGQEKSLKMPDYCHPESLNTISNRMQIYVAQKASIVSKNPIFLSEDLEEIIKDTPITQPVSDSAFQSAYKNDAKKYFSLLKDKEREYKNFIAKPQRTFDAISNNLNPKNSSANKYRLRDLNRTRDTGIVSELLESVNFDGNDFDGAFAKAICSIHEKNEDKQKWEKRKSTFLSTAGFIAPFFMGPLGAGLRLMMAARGLSSASHLAKFGVSSRGAGMFMDAALAEGSALGIAYAEGIEIENRCNRKMASLYKANDTDSAYADLRACQDELSSHQMMSLISASVAPFTGNLYRLIPDSIKNRFDPTMFKKYMDDKSGDIAKALEGTAVATMSKATKDAAKKLYAKMQTMFGKTRGSAIAKKAIASCMLPAKPKH